MGVELAARCSRREELHAGHSASAAAVDGEGAGTGVGLVTFVLLPTVSLLVLDPMRTNRFVDSGCACDVVDCDGMHSAECNDSVIVVLH